MSEIASVNADLKELASRAFADIIRKTANFFPDARYRPKLILDRTVNSQYGIDAGTHTVFTNSDGTGTKPNLAERLSTETGDYRFFERPAFDLLAMVADDAARRGIFILGVANSLDVNTADDPEFILALARGMEAACKAGRFPVLNGEIAELGDRTPGYGPNHLNWNASTIQLINRQKLIDGSKLKVGQPVVVLREKSIRSNGLTRARAIMENAFLQQHATGATRLSYVQDRIRQDVTEISGVDTMLLLNGKYGSHIIESFPIPWHTAHPELTDKLLTPSTIYAPLIYEAQGGVDGEVQIPLVACANISGGGVPLKADRMLEGSGLGLHLEAVFPDPAGVPELLELAERYPHPVKGLLVNDYSACEQWNRGVGFLCVAEDLHDAARLILLAREMGFEAELGGETIQKPIIEWRGHTWNAAA